MTATEERQIGERLRALGSEARITFRERAVEFAIDKVAVLFDCLEGPELRDRVVRLVSEIETEGRADAFLLSMMFGVFGVQKDDRLIADLLDRVAR